MLIVNRRARGLGARLLDEMTVLRVSARRDERAPDDANRRRSDDGGSDRNQD